MANSNNNSGSSRSGSNVTGKMETMLGKYIVDQGFCTQEELGDCLSLQTELQRQESHRSLTDILVANGYVTQTQLARIKAAVEEQKTFQQIPGYQIISKLGAGAMATVFKARQLSLDRIVAIKVLPKRMSENKEFVDRFYMEGKAAAKLNHPNIVAAYDVGEAGGYHYFVMEYVAGKTVYDHLIETGKPYPEKQALKITIQVCRALVHAHQNGLIHRDVKPKNIMVTSEGFAKLADMGLAREAEDKAAAAAEVGKAYGTPYYISPEQIRGQLNVDFRADIYSLGATMYHMVTGRVPFEAPSPAAVMHKHLKDDLVPPDHVNPELSAGISEIIEVAMAKDPAKRYASTSDMLADLESVARGEPPKIARRAYDLTTLAKIEKTGTATKPNSGEVEIVEAEEEPTIDLGTRTMLQRFKDPLVLALLGCLLFAIFIIILLEWKGS
ncbi:MAG: serine/threonine protein kinase [Phycisphaerae bacterium]